MMRVVPLLAMITLAHTLRAQPPNGDCAGAQRLCAHTDVLGNNTGGTAVPGFCGTPSTTWYTFVTNSVGGPATVSILIGDCLDLPDYDDELNAVVLQGDGTCTLTQFAAVSPCEESDIDFSVTTQALDPNTTYWIIVAGAMNNGTLFPAQCDFRLSVTGPGVDIIGVDMSAGTDRTIGFGEGTQLDGYSAGTIDWSPTAGLSGNGIPDPIASPSATTIYTMTSEIAGCTYTDDVTVEVIRRIEPPNTFTPNGDGSNDVFVPVVTGVSADRYRFDIFDRWGQPLFSTERPGEGWDGTHGGGTPVQDGVYVWKLTAKDPYSSARVERVGHVTLLR